MSRSPLRSRARALAVASLTSAAALTAFIAAPASATAENSHAVYTLTNSVAGNSVVAFRTDSQGHLTAIGSFPTGGHGTGGGLGSQGAVVASGEVLVAVNAGSSTISAFRIRENGSLSLLDTESSGGSTPISVTIHDHNIYALNAGSNTIAGFRLNGGHLTSTVTRPLSPNANAPAQVSFSPNGRHLVVTEKNSNSIDTFNVHHGVAGDAIANASHGTTPFGFGFDRDGHVVVSDAAGGGAGASEVTSYRFNSSGGLDVISEVPDTQTAACWIAVSSDGRHAFTTNAGSANVSSYDVAPNGALTLAAAVGTVTGGHPTDEVVGGSTLFVLDTAGARIVAAAVGSAGVLGASTSVATGLSGAVGIAAANLG